LVTVVVLGAITCEAATTAGPSRLIQANATMQRLGAWRIDQAPMAEGATRAFGSPTSCRPIQLENGSVMRWNSLGVRVVTATLGGMPEGKDACSYDQMPVAVVTVTGRAWFTSFGLRVGDLVTKLRRLYPRASFHRNAYGDSSPRDSFWLVTQRTTCLGVCGSARYVTAPRLVAQTRAGRVVALIFPVGAQGE
jgi:hypothetical protein